VDDADTFFVFFEVLDFLAGVEDFFVDFEFILSVFFAGIWPKSKEGLLLN
jgi:hypothetical protein